VKPITADILSQIVRQIGYYTKR